MDILVVEGFVFLFGEILACPGSNSDQRGIQPSWQRGGKKNGFIKKRGINRTQLNTTKKRNVLRLTYSWIEGIKMHGMKTLLG